MKYLNSQGDFHVGQEGEFLLYDAFHRPIETVRGEIVNLMEGDNSHLYAMIRTASGIRPARLVNNK